MKKKKKNMVDAVRPLDMVMTIHNRLDVDGLMVNVALLGGRQVLSVDNTKACLEEFFNYHKDVVESLF